MKLSPVDHSPGWIVPSISKGKGKGEGVRVGGGVVVGVRVRVFSILGASDCIEHPAISKKAKIKRRNNEYFLYKINLQIQFPKAVTIIRNSPIKIK
jgi:hypothetical protein